VFRRNKSAIALYIISLWLLFLTIPRAFGRIASDARPDWSAPADVTMDVNHSSFVEKGDVEDKITEWMLEWDLDWTLN